MPREIVTIECTEARKEGKAPSRYMTTRNKKLQTEKVELKKYNPFLRRHTLQNLVTAARAGKRGLARNGLRWAHLSPTGAAEQIAHRCTRTCSPRLMASAICW